MASPAKVDPSGDLSLARRLFNPLMIAAVWVPIAGITALHYSTGHEHHWVHDILRRAYYLPIVIAALRTGLVGALIGAVAVTAAYVPHAFIMPHHFDPARSIEKALEIVLYFTVAAVAGYLSGLEQRRRAELQLALEERERLTGDLVRAGRLSALGEVVAGIAHEIKNPLHSMAGTAEIIDPLVPKDAEERRMWEIHRGEIDRLKRVADRFLSFARPAPIASESLDLRDVATRLADLVEAQARQHDVALELDLPSDEVRIRGDMDQLAQVGLNIAVNAIKAIGDRGGKIRVSVGLDEHRGTEMASLSIENDGPAVPSEEIEQLFDPFHSGGDWTGLGLSISSRIAEQHGGAIEVSNGGLGVKFSLYLAKG